MRSGSFSMAMAAAVVAVSAGFSFAGITASEIVNYNPGNATNYSNTAAALGGLNASTGKDFWNPAFDVYLTPFNAAYSDGDLLKIGGGGSVTLKLSDVASANGLTIGVHTGFGLIDMDWPNGQNSDPASSYNDIATRRATVSVSADGQNWVSLGLITFDSPSNYYVNYSDASGYVDPTGCIVADFYKPFVGSLSSFDGANWQQTLSVLDGSAGGTWLDLSGTGLSNVSYIKFDVASGDAIFLDAVYGVAVPEPASLAMLGLGALMMARKRS